MKTNHEINSSETTDSKIVASVDTTGAICNPAVNPPATASVTVEPDASSAVHSTLISMRPPSNPNLYGPFLPAFNPRFTKELRSGWNLELFLVFAGLPKAGNYLVRKVLLAPSRKVGHKSNHTRLVSDSGVLDVESDIALVGHLVASYDPYFLRVAAEAPAVTYSYRTKDGKTIRARTIADAIALGMDGRVYALEFKSRARFEKLCLDEPDVYQRNDNGSFRSDPIAKVFHDEYGIEYVLVPTDDFPRSLMVSLVTLKPYILSALKKPVTDAERRLVIEAIAADPGIMISDIPIEPPARRLDVVKAMTVDYEIFPDYSHADVQQPHLVALYLSPLPIQALTVFHALTANSKAVAIPFGRRLPVGCTFKIGKRQFRVVHHTPKGIEAVSLQTNVAQLIAYETLHAAGATTQLSDAQTAMEDLVNSMDGTRLATFLDNWCRVSPCIFQGLTPDQADRQLRRLLTRYRKSGVRGLMCRSHQRGWRGSHKQDSRSSELLKKIIAEEFVTSECPSPAIVSSIYRTDAVKLGIAEHEQYTYHTIARRIAALRKYHSTHDREGARAALKHRPATTVLSTMGNPNGVAPMGTGHVDHSLADALVFNVATGKFERPWLSIMVDGYTGGLLAKVTWFGSPNSNTVIELLVDCIRRHGCLPWKIRVDHGREFFSARVQEAVASLGVSLAYRPAGEPRSGSPVETAFNALNEHLLHALAGNTKNRKAGREVTEEMKPENFATWTMECFVEITDRYIVVQNAAPRETAPSPDEMVRAYVSQHGDHCMEWSWISEETIRRICAHFPTGQTTRTVSAAASIVLRYCEYNADELQDLVGQDVCVFVDGLDARFAYFDHPQTRQRVTCKAVTGVVAHARNAAEANQIIESLAAGQTERKKQAELIYGKLVDTARQMEVWLRGQSTRGSKRGSRASNQSNLNFGAGEGDAIAA